jgi:hypothetical protein
MEDDPPWWRSPITHEEWERELAEAKQRGEEERKRKAEAEKRREAIRAARIEEFKDDPRQRKWAMWREYKAGGTTLREVGDNFGVTQERVRQEVKKCDRILQGALYRAIPTLPTADEVRDGILGVEFVFRNELTFTGWNGDTRGWNRLEPYEYGRSPAKPRKIYTYYRPIIPKEQTDATEEDNERHAD